MDPIVAALAAGSTPESHFDDQDGETDDEVAQHTDGASEGEQSPGHNPGTFTITEYQLLHRAVFSPTAGPEELKQLLEKGIDVDCTDHAGYTNLMMAINSGKGERATVLIRAGADVTKVNASGLSAFHFAAAKPALVQLKQLAQAGADSIDGLRAALAAENDMGKTPKDCAKDPQTRAWLDRLEAASDGELELFACGKSLETATATLAPPTPPRTLDTYVPVAASLLSMAVDVATWGVDSVTREFFEAWDDATGTMEYIKPGGDDSKVLRNWVEAPVWANSGALGF